MRTFFYWGYTKSMTYTMILTVENATGSTAHPAIKGVHAEMIEVEKTETERALVKTGDTRRWSIIADI